MTVGELIEKLEALGTGVRDVEVRVITGDSDKTYSPYTFIGGGPDNRHPVYVVCGTR